MPNRPNSLLHSRRGRRFQLLAAGLIAAAGIGTSLAMASASTSHSTAPLQKMNVAPYSNILANAALHSYYSLSIEKGAHLHCTGACLSVWIPFTVKSSVTSVPRTTGVKGHVTFIRRTSTTKQVIFNGYPIYTYIGDTKAKQISGEGVVADGGTWLLLAAGATTTSATPVKPKSLLTVSSASPYTNVLADNNHMSLYVLSAEVGGTLHCTGTCLSVWPPVLVPTSVTSILVATGVHGTIGFIARSGGMSQVTFNGYPVYRYTGDGGANGSSGEGVVADGGTWYLASAPATTPGATPIPVSSSTTTTTTYGYGY